MSQEDPGTTDEAWLQQFYTDHVFLLGDKDWRVGKNFFVVTRLVETITKWAYESSTGLYPEAPIPVGSHREGLHLQMEASSNNFDFLIPVRYNPKLTLMCGAITEDLSCYEQKLPTYIFCEKGLPVYRRGTKVLVDLEAAGQARAEVHCHKQEDDNLDLDTFNECKESLNHHNLDPLQTLTDFHHYVEIALDPAYTHPRQNDPVFQRRLFPSRVPKIDDRMRENIKLEALDLDGPAIQLAFLDGPETIPVNLIPAIRGAILLSNQWLREELTHLSDWWDGDLAGEKKSFLQKVTVVRDVGPELVAKGGCWRLAFLQAEAVILEEIHADGGQRQEALRLLKFVNSTRWTPEYGTVLTSYQLKTILLWSCEIDHQKAQWGTLLSSLQALLRVLRHTLAKGSLPHYFLRSVNLFGKCCKSSNVTYGPLALEALQHEVEVMLADPVGYLMPSHELQERCVSQEFQERMVALQQFKEKHQEELKEIKKTNTYTRK